MSAAYILGAVHAVLANRGVRISAIPVDDDFTGWRYERGTRWSFQQYARGLGAIHGATLRRLCEDLGLEFDEIRAQIEGANGLWRPGPPRA